MPLPTAIEAKLHKFANPRICYIEDFSQYAYNKKWLIDINDTFFKENLHSIFSEVNDHLKVGRQNLQFLKSMVDVLEKKLDWFRENRILVEGAKNHFFDRISIGYLSNELAPPTKEKYTIENIVQFDESSALNLADHEDYYYVLWRFRETYNFYENPLDLEKVKLFYVMKLLYENLIVAFGYLDDIILNFDQINFSEFDYEKLMERHGIIDGRTNKFKSKCHVTLNKKETAHLFATLLQLGLFYFNTNERKNRAELTKFIEANFTCKGDNGSINSIKNLNQEFTPVFYPNEKEIIPFLDILIQKLQAKKSELE